jgi:hypothetical protein
MLWGYNLLVGHRDQAGALLRDLHVDDWHARIGLEEMRSHRYLDAAGLVERTEFESAAITVNFGPEPHEGLGAGEYRIDP